MDDLDLALARGIEFVERNMWLAEHWTTRFLRDYKEFVGMSLNEEEDIFFETCQGLSLPRQPENIYPVTKYDGMNPKKRVEVTHLLPLLHAVSVSTNVLVDVGAGKCHAALAYVQNYSSQRVVCLEDALCICGGVWDEEKILKKDRTRRVTLKTCNFRDDTGLDINEPYTLYSLHACGPLSHSILKHFVREPNAVALCSIGCCYHFLGDLLSRSVGWSKDVFGLGNHDGRAVGDEVIESLYRRSLLELASPGATQRQSPSSFGDYLNVNTSLQWSEAECHALYELHLHKKPLLSKLWKMRSAMGPVVESVILRDRLLFLRRRGYENARLEPVWDPVGSPRNMAIVARKLDC